LIATGGVDDKIGEFSTIGLNGVHLDEMVSKLLKIADKIVDGRLGR
jgi:hypothetical protein